MKSEPDKKEVQDEDEFSEKMKLNLNHDVDEVNHRILQMKIKAPACKEGNKTNVVKTKV